MTPLALRLLTVLALFLPAASESARLILVNGDDVRDIAIVSMQVPANGVVVIVPDVIFAADFESRDNFRRTAKPLRQSDEAIRARR